MRRLLVVLAACGSPSPSVPNKTSATEPTKPTKPTKPAAPSAPDLDGIRAAVAPHDLHLFDDASIKTRGCPHDMTLGDYVALLVKYGLGEPGTKDTHRLTGGCQEFPSADKLAPIDPPSDPAYWYCRIDSYTVDPEGESPWHYELRLRIRKADGAADLATLSCPGTP